jgi:Skp family chaperone for outer membrane proteins
MRAVLWMGSVVVGLAVIVGASRLWAESKEKKPAVRTRIGLVNLTYVINNYDKYKEYKEEMKTVIEPYQKRDAELRSKLEELRKKVENPSLLQTAGKDRNEKSEKERLEKEVKEIQRRVEENKETIQKKLAKRSDDQMKVIYKDIMEATQSYATSNDLDLVLHYNDAINHEDFLSAQNIARKLNTGALMPLYSKEEMDISQDLVTLLNQKMHKK